MVEREAQDESEITTLLEAMNRGDQRAAAELLPLVYAELRRLAASRMANLPPGQTLQPTALVHEAYLKLIGTADPGWNGRGHFFAAAARAMREIIVDQARRKARIKHGGDRRRVSLDEDALSPGTFELPFEDMLELDGALSRLEAAHPRPSEIVMLRYFAGLTNEQIGAALGVSTRTVERGWRFARAWLHQEMTSRPDEPPGSPT